MQVKRAIVSVTNKKGVVNFCRFLDEQSIQIISTGGTAKLLREANIPVSEVADITHFPEMLEGRLKTLHPVVHGGILAERSKPEHMSAIAEHGILPIDMVVVNLYDFAGAAERKASRDELVENIDIGGSAMIRGAAKNWQDLAVVTHPADYGDIAREMMATDNGLGAETLWRLSLKAFRLTGEYDTQIYNTLALLNSSGERVLQNA
jgi:phosphoribosylaminoimidazolecarboxamide formyltransferase / IMP cyclohydrolase